MPSEKFYDSATAVEGDGSEPVVNVSWGKSPNDQIQINGVDFDHSAIDRLIKVLTRAKASQL